ncbi:hypothetical protein CK203_063931 [Vitis vinifera]|uniref:Uncharacterized protein n=1 Tax=Vitis vinifera TaxID=29760 RepID=A0A438FPU6_VITVI|nr:hypothetical protein CK203_063931 [Vitis vinifera]
MLIEVAPWYAHIANYLVTGEVPRDPQSLPQKRMWRPLYFSETTMKAYRTAYKTILGMSSYRIVYGKACHLSIEVQYKAWWEIKTFNMDLNRADMKRFLDHNEMEELRNDAYNNSNIAKQRLNRWHDQLVSRKEF